MTELTGEQVIAAYIKLRNRKDRATALYKAEIAKYDEDMAKMENWLQARMAVDNLNALPTDSGTAFKQTTEHASVSDMDALLKFIKDNEAWHLLEKRVSKTGVKGYLEENLPLPPGVDWFTKTEIRVRKPSER